MKPETQMNPRQYTLSTGKSRITLQAGQTNIHKAAPGETYRVLKRQGENDQEKLADDVVASRHGQDLQLDYADGTTVTLQDWYSQSDTSVTLPADGTSTQLMTPASTEGAALADGSPVIYAHGSADALSSMTSGHPGLESILSGLQNNSVVSGHPLTYLPQSHSYLGYAAGALGLGGVIGVAAASGHSGHDGGGKHDNGGGEATVENSVQLNFVGGPALSSNDLNVEIYQADGKTLIGTGTLGANGSVTLSAGSYSGVVIVKLVNSGSAADYLDEATGAGKDLSAQLWSMGVISGDNSTLVLNINVLTTIAYTKAQEALGGTPDNPATLNAAQVADTAAALSSLLGVDNILDTTVVATNGGSFDATDGLSAGEKYGLMLAAFSGAEANAGASTQTILDTVIAGITLGSSNSLSDSAQSLLIKGAATASDSAGGVSLIIDTHAPVFSSGTTASVDENSGAGQVVWTAVATDPSQFSYSLSTAGDSALFSINAATGAVTLTGNPDYESKASYSFTVVATDAAGNASSQTVTLSINNLDEVAPTITSGTTATAINENSGAGQVVYTATATDTADISGGVTFSLKAGSDAGLTINPTTGAVTLTGNPDYESKASYSFTVVATDAAGNASSQTVTLSINNLDEVAPTITSGTTATAINENSGAGQVVYTATATDTADISGGVTFSLKAGSDAGLTINPTTGAVTLTGNPDYESKASYSFTVVATDAAGNHSDRTVTLAINNLDEVAPTITSGATATALNENSGAGQVVYTATATDTGDISGGVTFSLKAGSDAGLTINPTTGAVTLTGNPDYESKASYSFTVVATDAAGNHSDRTVTLAINNLDEVAPSFTTGDSSDNFASATVNFAENTAASTPVYTAQANDNDAADGGEHVSYSLIDTATGTDAQYFTIDATTGAVTFKASPDYEGIHAPAYTFVVVATDAAGHATTQTVTVNVTDVDEMAPTVTLDGSSTGPVMLSPGSSYMFPNGFDTTALGDGSFLVTWAGNNNDSSGIYVQRLSAQGVALGDAVQLASGTTNTFLNSSDSIVSVTAINNAGAYALAWTSKDDTSNDTSIYTQLFNADGTSISAAVKLDGAASAQDIAPQIAALANGGYIVTWYINGGDVYVQRFDDTGVAVGSTAPLAVSGSSGNVSPQVAVLDNGGYVVTWQGQTSNDYHIYVQQFDATGTGATPVVLDATTGNTNRFEVLPQITALTGGGYVVTWSGYEYNNSNNDSSTYVQQFDATGAKVGSIVVLDGLSNGTTGGSYTYPYIAALADGGYAISWMEYNNSNGSYGYDVYVQQFTAGGSQVGTIVQLDAPGNNTINSEDQLPRITALGDGGYVVTWMGTSGPDWDVYAQKFNASGVAVGDIVQLQASGGALDLYPQVTAVGTNGEYAVTWYGFNPSNGMSDFHLYVQKFNADGSIYENLVVLNHDGHATVQSTENGTIYLVNDNVVVSQLSDITGAASNQWASTAVIANTSASVSAANLADGTYHAYAVDAAGNLSVISGSSVMVDNTVPVFTSAATAADITDSTAVGNTVYTAAATDAHGITYSLNDTVHFRINASTGVVTLLSSPAQATGAQFIVTATDAAGNQTTQTVTYNVVDTTPPGVTLITDQDGVEHNGQHVTVQSTEAGTIYLVSDSVAVTSLNSLTSAADNLVNSVSVTANTDTTLALTGLADGTYHAYAVDASGNVSAISGSSVIVDNTLPVFTSAATAADITDSTAVGDIVYTAAATDANGITYSLSDTQHFSINASTGVVTLLSSPAQATGAQFIVTATDAAGNQTTQTVTYNVVDTTAPGVTLIRDVDGVQNGNEMVIVRSTEAGTIYLVNDSVTVTNLNSLTSAADNLVNSVAVTANAAYAMALTGLADGTYNAYAVDASGNISVISGSSVIVDNTVPVFTSASTAANITDSTAVGDTVYTAIATDAHGVTYSLNDTQHFSINASTGVVTLLSSPAKATGAQFIVTATDAAGNQTTHTVIYNVVDTTPPGVTLVRDADGVENGSETVSVQSTEAGTVYLVSDSVTVTNLSSLTSAADNLVNSVAVAANAGTTLALTGLADGTYHAYAVDAAGNVSAISGSSVIVDNTAPVISGGATATGTTITSGAAAGTQVYDANASDANNITYSLDPNSLAFFNINATTGVVTLNSAAVEGNYNFTVTVTDAAGNYSSQTVSLEVAAGSDLTGRAMISGSTTDTSTEMTVNIGLEKLSNGYTVMEYMRQTGGDDITYDPTSPVYDGVVRVLDAGNNVIKTLDISVPTGYTMLDTQVKALANGGFVVAWSQVDVINYTDYSVHYAIYDNSGNLQSSNTLASPGSGVTIAAQSSANGGDFAIAYQTMGSGTDQQEAVSVFHYNGSGTSFTEGTQTLIGGNNASQNFGGVASPAVQLMKFQLTPGVLTALSDGSYVLASEVYDWIGTPGQAATTTPIGAFIFKLDSTGTLANFDSGSTWQRVNWNDEQSSPTNVIAFDGGFAVFSKEYRGATWEVTLYNNNGTLITTNIQSNAVYGMGTQSYHAVDVGAMDTITHYGLQGGVYGYLAASATAYDNGTDLVFVFPDGNGGFSQTTISKTTGELTSAVTDSGITVPQGGQLYNPRIVSDGAGGYDITYSVLFDSDTSDGSNAGYVVGDIYQIGLNAGAVPVAPTVTDAHISITSTPGGADGTTYKVGDTVTAVWDNSSSGDANTSTVSSVTMDFSQFGASTPATAYDDGTHGDAVAGDGKYTAQYTITAGAIDHVAGRNVAVTVTTASHTTATAADTTGLTVDSTAPVLTSSTPQDDGSSVATGANLTLTFSENVLAGSGHITLVNDSNSSLNKVIDITDSSQVSISGHTVTINPTTDLAAGANYHVQIDSTALHDTAGNDYAGISTSTGLNFTTAAASIGDPSIVVFDLTTGQSSDHNGRVFDANTAYTIYIKVNSTTSSLVGLDSNEMWSGAQNLGTDDKIVLVGSGSAVKGNLGGQVTTVYHPGNAVNWITGFSTSNNNAAVVHANGQFARNGVQNVDLWNGTWAANPDADNTFAQVYLQAMPAGVLTSQGLALP